MYRIETVDVLGSPMEVFVFEPERAGPRPGLILCQHIPVGHAGLEHDTFTLAAAERFAANGLVVAVPFIFHWWPKTAEIQQKRAESRDDWTVADLRATLDLLAHHPRVRPERVGIAGHCWGGRVAWLGACHLTGLAACAIFYGGRIKRSMGEGQPPAIELANRIRCPVIGFFGNEDQNPPPADVDDYAKALDAAGVTYEFHRYEGAGHAFKNFASPERYRETASEDAWQKVLGFLASHLGSDVLPGAPSL